MGKEIKRSIKKQGFTLVELIIVIAIIAVLAVAAFMMLTKWLGKSRDSRRLGDMATIKKALEVTYSDTDRGLNMYPDPTDSVDILDGSGVVMWNQGVFGLDTIGEMDNMQKAPQDPGDDSYYKYAVTLDKKEFQLATVLEDGSDVSVVGSVFAADGQVKLDGNYDGYVSYPTTGGTMIFKTPSLLVKGEAKIEVFSGSTDKFMLNGESEGANLELRSVKTDENTSAVEVADALGIDEKSAAIVLKKETGAVVIVEQSSEELEEKINTPAGWMLVDTNCKNQDITVGNLVWAGCNSTKGNGVEFGKRYSGADGIIDTCYNYDTDNFPSNCVIGAENMSSNTSEMEYFNAVQSSGSNKDGESAVDNIWGKLYTWANISSACTDGRRVPTEGDFVELETEINGGSACSFAADGSGCNGLGWLGKSSKNNTNNLVNALKIPLSGYIHYDGATFRNRGYWAFLWSSTQVDSSHGGGRAFGSDSSYMYHSPASGRNKADAFSIRCVKDGESPEPDPLECESSSATCSSTNITSCKDLVGGGYPSGVYWIDLDAGGLGVPFKVYCDMETDGGGWTLVVAQYESDYAPNWNEGIQLDYDPSLATKKGFTLNSSQLPTNRTEVAFGKDLDPTFVGYSDFVYTTGNIAKTELLNKKDSINYHIHRDGANFYGGHDPEYTRYTGADWSKTLTYDKTGGIMNSWAFVLGSMSGTYRGYSMNGEGLTETTETFAWTVWVR